jgi:hypothetical protein
MALYGYITNTKITNNQNKKTNNPKQNKYSQTNSHTISNKQTPKKSKN